MSDLTSNRPTYTMDLVWNQFSNQEPEAETLPRPSNTSDHPQEWTLLPLLPFNDCYSSWTLRPDNVPTTQAVQLAKPFKSPPEIKTPLGAMAINRVVACSSCEETYLLQQNLIGGLIGHLFIDGASG
ncbi:hypothetical protein AVEN_235919-1 [Araneus ventricosus]|uniref:Uncharacterized protein n=1 Tax=Araneus ventricosus TaxID=182803 RepID=A0A4Y2RHV9_ARAVE|nr:hypothetical protein AVEN_235919-1 [Araneus ventricosus]